MAQEKRKSVSDVGPVQKKAKTEYKPVPSEKQQSRKGAQLQNGHSKSDGKESFLNGKQSSLQRFLACSLTSLSGISSKEAHHKQKALRAERVAAKPNADSIARSKKIWERLRIKSAVPKDERQKLVAELFTIINGRVKEFVFKHDSVRVIQCALKYATPEQKAQIAEELKGSYKELAESKYAKFLIAKLIVLDSKVRDLVVPEFYGHVKRLIRHPEAGWILDDIYRSVATPEQKARLLREWYGGEYAVLGLQEKEEQVTATLSEILRESPGKKGPIMQHLKEMTNQLVQKKTTGFTMLHDALLQYFLNCTPGSPEHTEFLEMLRDDEEGDLFKNLAFTKSGSRIVCLALAHGSSKDRRNIIKHYKTHIKLMSTDTWAHLVILTAYEVIDDTVMTAKAVFPELLSKELDAEAREQELLRLARHINGRIPLLYLMAEEPPKWLLETTHHEMIQEIREIRKQTSKKDAPMRRTELNKALSQPLLDFIASQAESLLQSSYGCQFVGEVLIGSTGDKEAAMNAIVAMAIKDSMIETVTTPNAGRLYKVLVQGGRFDVETKTVAPVNPPLGFDNLLYNALQEKEPSLHTWATGPNSWTVVAMLESKLFSHKDQLLQYLQLHQADLEKPQENPAASSGIKVLLEMLGSGQSRKTRHVKEGKVSMRSTELDNEEGGVPIRTEEKVSRVKTTGSIPEEEKPKKKKKTPHKSS